MLGIIKNILYTALLILLFSGCNCQKEKDKNRSEVIQTEKAFEKLASEKGIAYAFSFYADKDAVINRNDSLIKGKKAISDFYNSRKQQNVTLKWSPDFTELSESNDLAYTFGKYTYTITDSTGNIKVYKGIFHTVWKRQTDGSWKYVWD